MSDIGGAESFKTNTEKLLKVKEINFNKEYPAIIQWIYDLILYEKLNRILCKQDQMMVDKWIRDYNSNCKPKQSSITIPLNLIFRHVNSCLRWRDNLKEMEINKQEQKMKLEKYNKENYKEKEPNEVDCISGLSEAELAMRNIPYPKGIYHIPDSIVYKQKLIENGKDGDISYYLFNKVYGYWFGAVTSPHRINADGTKNCVRFCSMDWNDLKRQLRINIIKEENYQREYMSKRNKIPNIQRVKDIMGINVDPNLNGDEIF